MFQRIFVVFIAGLMSTQVSAQVDTFYRTYMTSQNDTSFYHLASESVGGNLTSMGVRRFETQNMGLVFFGQDKKGNITWQREVDFGKDTTNLIANGSLSLDAQGDSLFFSAYGFNNGDRIQYYGKMPKDGSEVEIRSVGGNEFFNVVSGRNLLEVEAFIGGTQLVSPSASRATIGRVGPGFEEVWSKSYQFEDVNGDLNDFGIFDIKSTVDSTIVILGTDTAQTGFMVTELDSNGVQLWAEDFDLSGLNIDRAITSELVRLENGNTAIIGFTDVGTTGTGYVVVLDTMGEISSSFDMQVDGLSTRLRDVIQGSDGNLWISGVMELNDSLRVFISNVTEDGDVLWTSTYNSPNNVAVPALRSSDLHPLMDVDGVVFGGHGFDNDMDVYASMKLNGIGNGFCSDTIPSETNLISIANDTLIASDVLGGMFFSEVEFEYETTSLLTPPNLNVSIPGPFCPNEPIDTILVARVTGVDPANLIYEWEGGIFNDTLRISENGAYMVTVTVLEDVCYTMCDTVMVNEYSMPMLTLAQSIGDFCETGEVQVGFNYQPGHPQIQTISWSTGESSEIINILPPADVGVTVTDFCNQPATATLDVTIPDVSISSPIAGFNCQGDIIRLSSAAIGAETFTWMFNGEVIGNGAEVFVDNVEENYGQYTVTFANECGDESTLTVDVDVENEAIIDIQCVDDANQIIISAFNTDGTTQGLELEIRDENSTVISSDNPFTGPDNRPYLAVVYNGCELDRSLQNLLEQEINPAFLCGAFYNYPNVFFPGGVEESEEGFGPIPSDSMSIDLVTESEFKVFNRWGQEVFSSTEILPRWDGTQGGSDAPSEVYIYYHRYRVEGREEDGFAKGDVTLIR